MRLKLKIILQFSMPKQLSHFVIFIILRNYMLSFLYIPSISNRHFFVSIKRSIKISSRNIITVLRENITIHNRKITSNLGHNRWKINGRTISTVWPYPIPRLSLKTYTGQESEQVWITLELANIYCSFSEWHKCQTFCTMKLCILLHISNMSDLEIRSEIAEDFISYS